jgi:hypothetical protein
VILRIKVVGNENFLKFLAGNKTRCVGENYFQIYHVNFQIIDVGILSKYFNRRSC